MSSTDTIEFTDFVFYKPLTESELEADTCLYTSAMAVFEQYSTLNEQDTIIYRESLFQNHKLIKKSPNEQDRIAGHFADWVFPTLLGLFLLLSLILRLSTYKTKDFIASLFSVKSQNTTFIGGTGKKSIIAFVFSFYTFSCSLFIYWLLEYYGMSLLDYRSFVVFSLLFLAFTLLIFIKYLIINILGRIFQTKGNVRMYIFNAVNYGFLISVVLSFFLPVLFFGEPEIQRGTFFALIVCLGLLFFFRILIGLIMLFFELKSSKPYLFLYLCIIEILPIMALVKYIIR